MNNLSKGQQKTLDIYCVRCKELNAVRESDIFSGGIHSKYATKCPNCGLEKPLTCEEVEKAFGELKV